MLADDERALQQIVGLAKISGVHSDDGLRGEGVRDERMLLAKRFLVYLECARNKLLGLRSLPEVLVRGGQTVPRLRCERVLRAKRALQDCAGALEERLCARVVAFHPVTQGQEPHLFGGEEIVWPACSFRERDGALDEWNRGGVITDLDKARHLRP